MQLAVDQILTVIGSKFVLPEQFLYVCMSMGAGLMAISVVDRAIKFSYHFFLITKNEEAVQDAQL
jgi:hypothetical protein